jgi:hypothetical protein
VAGPLVLRRAAVAVVILLSAAAAYEGAIALGAIPLGRLPGEDAAATGEVLAGAVVALLAGASVALTASTRRVDLGVAGSLLAPAAAAFVAARSYAFDPYYLPTLRRMSDGGLVSPVWVIALAVAALVAAPATRVLPRLGLVVSGAIMVLCAFTAVAQGLGH